jgi:hypothetical protein
VIRHINLTCKNHRELRWTCKEVAWTDGEGYNGSRNVFFEGHIYDTLAYKEGTYADRVKAHMTKSVPECNCPIKNWILAPEEEAFRIANPDYKSKR